MLNIENFENYRNLIRIAYNGIFVNIVDGILLDGENHLGIKDRMEKENKEQFNGNLTSMAHDQAQRNDLFLSIIEPYLRKGMELELNFEVPDDINKFFDFTTLEGIANTGKNLLRAGDSLEYLFKRFKKKLSPAERKVIGNIL